MKLSVEDRNRVSEEINGVFSMAPEETPELIQSSLQKLAIELDAIPFKKKVAYQRSQQSLSSSSSGSSGSDDSSSSNSSASSSKNNSNIDNNNDTNRKASSSTTTSTSTSTSRTTYVNDDAFRLRFLRAELFDVHLTAIRIVKYLDFVLELFGPYALERPIELSDFTKREIKYLQMGYVDYINQDPSVISCLIFL